MRRVVRVRFRSPGQQHADGGKQGGSDAPRGGKGECRRVELPSSFQQYFSVVEIQSGFADVAFGLNGLCGTDAVFAAGNGIFLNEDCVGSRWYRRAGEDAYRLAR